MAQRRRGSPSWRIWHTAALFASTARGHSAYESHARTTTSTPLSSTPMFIRTPSGCTSGVDGTLATSIRRRLESRALNTTWLVASCTCAAVASSTYGPSTATMVMPKTRDLRSGISSSFRIVLSPIGRHRPRVASAPALRFSSQLVGVITCRQWVFLLLFYMGFCIHPLRIPPYLKHPVSNTNFSITSIFFKLL